MTVFQYLESLNMDFTAKARLFGIITGDTSYENLTFQSYIHKARKMEMPEEFIVTDDNLLDILVIVNKMVKHDSCLNNLRNRFYNQKKTIIKYLIREKRVSDIYGQGDYYSMVVDGKYRFHQPREFFRNFKLDVKGEQEYTSGETPIPFDEKVYDKFQILYYIYTGQFRLSRMGHSHDPHWYNK